MQRFEPPIYLDYAASTPLDSRVLEEMMPVLTSVWGNPSSTHAFGRHARAVVDLARDRVAEFLHAEPSEICFTSGGTEADNLAVIGGALAASPERRRVVVGSLEHHAVLNAARSLSGCGFEIVEIQAEADGCVSVDHAAALIDDRTALVSVQLANNETGAIQPVKEIAKLARQAGALMHSDAVQAAGLLRLDPDHLHVDMLSISAHKFYGPKFTGALWVRRGLKVSPVIFGGAQERERRAGTENVAGVAGMGKAADLARTERLDRAARVEALRDDFARELEKLDDVVLLAKRARRLPSILNYTIQGTDAEVMLMRLDALGVAASSGAACASGSLEPSHVLQAMGLPLQDVKSSLRFSFGEGLRADTVRQAAECVRVLSTQMRRLAGARTG